MKHTLSSTLALCFMTTLAYAQTQLDVKVPDRVEHDLVGPVEMVKEISKTRNLFGSGKKSTSEEIRTYDAKGNRLIKKVLDEIGEMKSMTEYQYDENGCFVKEIVEDTKKDTHEAFSITIDVDRRIILKENLETHEKKATLYTKTGYEDRIKKLDSNGEVIETVEIKRWPNQKDRKYSYFDGDHKPTQTATIDWNRDGTPKEMRFEDYVKDSRFTIEYEYSAKDSKGNWTERTETTTLFEKGKTIPLTRVVVSRIIEYY